MGIDANSKDDGLPEDGVIAVGGELSVENLVSAYRHGVFPWPMSSLPDDLIPWFCPPQRGILEFNRLHIPASLARARRRNQTGKDSTPGWQYTFDRAFDRVIQECSKAYRPGQSGTWITQPMIDAYKELHRAGYAHSVEVWEGNELVGGLYGVEVDGVFAGESMFRVRPNASKLALLHLIEFARAQGLEWIDIQMVTPHLEALGAREIPRATFLRLHARTRAKGLRLFGGPTSKRDPDT